MVDPLIIIRKPFIFLEPTFVFHALMNLGSRRSGCNGFKSKYVDLLNCRIIIFKFIKDEESSVGNPDTSVLLSKNACHGVR